MQKIVNFIKETFKTQEFIPLHEPRFVGNEKKYLNKQALDWYFAKTSVSFCEDYLCMMRNLNQIDLEYAHCRNRSG